MRLFVTGTGTGVGKTLVTACLAAAARGRGVLACKPVASGVEPGTAGEDAALLAQAAGHAPLVFAAYAAPISPHRAAEREGATVGDDVFERVRALQAPVVLVEGVGGWRVPLRLDPPRWVADLARATGPDVLVVAADQLGTLNHTLLTAEAVRADGFRLAGIVLSQGAPEDASRATNLDDLRQLCDAPVWVAPRLDPTDLGALRHLGATLWRGILGPAVDEWV